MHHLKLILDRIVCLFIGHLPEGRLRFNREAESLEAYYWCNRCGKELRDEGTD